MKQIHFEKTLFLDWKKIGDDVWKAKDPIDPKIRWVVCRSNHQHYTMWYKVYYTKDGKEHGVGYSQNVIRAQWIPVTFRLNQLADMACSIIHTNGSVPSWEDSRTACMFLNNFTEFADAKINVAPSQNTEVQCTVV